MGTLRPIRFAPAYSATSHPGDRRYLLRSPEDILLARAGMARLGGEVSDRQWSDAVGVLKV